MDTDHERAGAPRKDQAPTTAGETLAVRITRAMAERTGAEIDRRIAEERIVQQAREDALRAELTALRSDYEIAVSRCDTLTAGCELVVASFEARLARLEELVLGEVHNPAALVPPVRLLPTHDMDISSPWANPAGLPIGPRPRTVPATAPMLGPPGPKPRPESA